MSKAYFSLGNTYSLSRGKKDALVVSPGPAARCTAINRAAGGPRLGAGTKVYLTLEDGGQSYVLDPSKSKGKDLMWSKSMTLSKKQTFQVNVLEDRPFGVGCYFSLSYRVPETKTTKHLCFGQGAEPLPLLSESSDNLMRLTVTDILVEDEGSSEDSSEKEAGSAPEPAPMPAAQATAPVECPPSPPAAPGAENARDSDAEDDEPPVADRRYVVEFQDGALGVKLKRSKQGTLLVQDIIAQSQAMGKGIEVGDKFCMIGSKDVSDHAVDDDEFASLVAIIKEHPRPLPITFERGVEEPEEQPAVVEASPSVTQPPALSSPPSAVKSSQQEIDDTNALRRLADRLIVNPAGRASVGSGLAGLAAAIAKPRTASVSDAIDHNAASRDKQGFALVQDGRRIVKHGEIDVLGRGTLWNTKCNKYVFLLSDVILVTTVKGKNFHLESVIDHNVCKFDPSPMDPGGGKVDSDRFDLRWPGGTLEICFKDAAEKEMWVRALSDAICYTVFAGKDSLSFGWRHMYIHGTLHSAILSRDENLVRSIIEACENGSLDISILDARDEDMFTPLHFACILRQPRIAELLLNSHVDCTIPDGMGRTAFHWCAAQLDAPTLELLCSRVFDVDVLDDSERTPLYVACIEGRDAQGLTDVKALVSVIEVLSKSGANPNVVDAAGLSPIHYVAASLQFGAIEALLKAKALVNVPAANSAGWTPLHYACACVPLKKAVGEGYRTLHPSDGDGNGPLDGDMESIYISDVGRTIGKLLEYGAWPNARAGKLKCSPLQLLTLADGLGDPLYQLAAELLVTSGSRLDDSMGTAVKNPRFLELRDDFGKCHEEFTRRPTIDATMLALCPGAYLTEASVAAEGSSSAEIVCGPCGSSFSMLKRKHRCRLCEVTCCDDCSKRRVSLDGSKEEIRCCDGCFNRVFAEVEKEKKAIFLASIKPAGQQSGRDAAAAVAEENRKVLFAGSIEKSVNSNEHENKVDTRKATAASTASVLSEARQNLQERGEKLNQLSDKTDKLAAASSDFADMAKQLKKQQQRSSWWG